MFLVRKRQPSRKITPFYLRATFTLIAALLCLAFNFSGYFLVAGAKASSGTTYYVSKNGNNANGQSWATAWNELASINWSVVQPGDTILLDGGGQSMTYTTTMTIAKSGTQSAPITIERSTEGGHNGHVVLYGGGSPLPYCGQTNYVYQKPQRQNGIYFGSSSWIVLDGMSWDGISVYGYISDGVEMTGGSNNDTLRNMEIYENGAVFQNGGTSSPDSGAHGIHLTGANLTFEYMNIYDNADDEFNTELPAGVHNITIDYSWMHVSRENPTQQGLPFNDCVHQDGYQISNGGVQSGILIENSVVGPGLGEGVILGQQLTTTGVSAKVNNVTLRNNLMIDKNRNILGYPQVFETGWVIDHDTVVTQGKGISGGTYEALFLEGSNNTVTNSIFYDGIIYLPDGLAKSTGNCQWKTIGDTQVIGGQTVDPQFVTDISSYTYSTSLAVMANENLALRSTSPCKRAGSSITSVNSFLQMVKATNSTPQPGSTPGSSQSPVANTTTGSGNNNGQNPIPDGFETIVWVILGLVFIGAIALLFVIYRKRSRDSIY